MLSVQPAVQSWVVGSDNRVVARLSEFLTCLAKFWDLAVLVTIGRCMGRAVSTRLSVLARSAGLRRIRYRRDARGWPDTGN